MNKCHMKAKGLLLFESSCKKIGSYVLRFYWSCDT